MWGITRIVVLLVLATLLSGLFTIVESSSKVAKQRSKAHFVFVHGAGHGAWCWYKVVTMLEQTGYTATALDLPSQGRDNTNPDSVTSQAQNARPLTDFLSSVTEKVILVPHSLGGEVVSFAMEIYPEKVSKAIFVAAFMASNSSEFTDPNSAPSMVFQLNMVEGRAVLYGNGPQVPPTSLAVNLSLVSTSFYSGSPPADITLAKALLKPTPYGPIVDTTYNLTPSRYGSVRRFYIKTGRDKAIPPIYQKRFIETNPVERAFTIAESDHSPFFSFPEQLVRLLSAIAGL